ncbi:MAG TPA: arsenic resistance N-acetyltransferase ArsN2, partial [Longimicrobiales bacterium]|nr:arsenic resistance N-acetyltransferase ArsN2 [Longimicrobiales bacterium]
VSCCAPITKELQVGIRDAQNNDLSGVTELIQSSNLPIEGVTDQFPQGYAVATYGDRIVGVAGVEVYGGDGLLRSVAVHNARRGFGVGVQLVRDRLQWARHQQLRDVYLLTTTASAFFERLGFEHIERASAPEEMQRAPEFADLCPSTSTVMKLGVADGAEIRAIVRDRYGAAARAAANDEAVSCACCGDTKSASWNPVTYNLYEAGEVSGLPSQAVLASLGCGNPTALAQLSEGETVLDLGSGGGIDVLLSAKRVGPTGKAFGLDMTDEMLALARSNQEKAGATNVEFLKGEIENIPLPDESVDVIISNCVINLAADKSKVISEAFRVLKPGGRFAVSDIVTRGEMPDIVRRNGEMWTGCIAGALEETEYVRLLHGAGFENAEVEPTRIYSREDAIALAADAHLNLDQNAANQLDGAFMSAFVRALKPARA